MTMMMKMPRGLASAGVRADASDPKALLEALNKTFAEFKAEHSEALKKADVVQSEKVDRINAEIGKIQAALDETNSRLAAARLGLGDDDAKPLAAEKKLYAAGFDRFFRKGLDAGLSDLAVKAAATSDKDGDGGYTVPEQMESAIGRVLATVSTVRSISNVMTISSSSYKKLMGMGGATSGWVGEKETRTETDTPTLQELRFTAMELYANPAATQGLLDDSAVDIAAWLADEVSQTFADAEGAAFVSGSGVNQPRGILSYTNVANASYAWGSLGYFASGVAAALTDGSNNGIDALTNVIYGIKQGYRNNARWLMNRTTAGTVRKIKDSNGQYLWQPPVQAGAPSSLLGYPVSDDDNMPDIGANAYPIAFGDFNRGYLIVDRQGVRVLRDPYTNKPYVHFYTTKRVGGGIQNFEALKLLKIAAS